MLLLTNNNKKSTQKLRQVFASIILSASCIIPVVAGNEKTHVDKPKKSTSSWLRTGLELLLGAGCVGGVVREFQNRNTIKSKDEEISKLNQTLNKKDTRISDLTRTIEEKERGLTDEQQTELKTLKVLIGKVYNEQEYTKYLTITDENVGYKVDAIITLANENQLNLSQTNFAPNTTDGIVKTYITTKSPELKIPLDTDYASVHKIPPYDLCLLLLINLEDLYASNLLNTELANTINTMKKTLEDQSDKLTKYDSAMAELLEDLKTPNLTDNQKSKLVYKYCIRKLMTLANVKPAMDHYWNIVQANGQTIQTWKGRTTTPGEALLVLTCQSLFDGQITETTITPANLCGALCTTEFYALRDTTVHMDRKQIKFKAKTKEQRYPKITDISMKQITNHQLAQLFANKYLISQLLFTLYNNSSERNKDVHLRNSAQLALDELTLIYLASKFIKSYTTSEIPVLEDTKDDSHLKTFIEQADNKWTLFEQFMDENQLSKVNFSNNRFKKQFVFSIVEEKK